MEEGKAREVMSEGVEECWAGRWRRKGGDEGKVWGKRKQAWKVRGERRTWMVTEQER